MKLRVIDGGDGGGPDVEQRILWVTEKSGIRARDGASEEPDNDAMLVLVQLLAAVRRGDVDGLVVGALRRDGRADLIAAGVAFDAPLIGSGLSTRLASLLHDWPYPLRDYIPDD